MKLKDNKESASTKVEMSVKGNIARITLNAPKELNAFSQELAADFRSSIESVTKMSSIDIVVLQAEGSVFSAGANIKEVGRTADKKKYFERLSTVMYDTFYKIMEAEQLVIATARGNIVGVALPLVLCCDMVWVDENARMIPGYLDIGLFPNGGLTFLLPEISGARRSMELLLIEKQLGAKAALGLGLASAILGSDSFEKEITDRLQLLQSGVIKQYKKTKELMNKKRCDAFKEHLQLEKPALLASAAESEFEGRLSVKLEKIENRKGSKQ